MDRLALAAIATGLVLILGIVGMICGGHTSGDLPALAAAGAALAGSAIVSGLVVLERRSAAARAGSQAFSG